MRIILLTHFYAPEIGAPQTRLAETVRELANRGHRVTVVTGPPHYPDGHVRAGYSPFRPTVAHEAGTRVVRLPMIPRPNLGIVDRVVDQGSFSLAALSAAACRGDVYLVESPPLFLAATGALVSLIGNRPLLLHVADPWPDFPIAMGALRDPRLIRGSYALERLAYARAARITTVTEGLVDLLAAKPAAAGKVALLPNGVDVDRFQTAHDRVVTRRSMGWSDELFHASYIGTVGLAQGVGTLLDAAAGLVGRPVQINIVGDGAERRDLEEAARRRGLSNVRFHDPVPRDRVPALLTASDAAIVMLRRGALYEHSLPTKLVEALAAGRPVVVAADGEAARIVAEAGAGFTAPAEDVEALRAAIVACSEGDLRQMGERGRAAARRDFDRRELVGRLEGYLREAVERHGRTRGRD